jgi:hypothetical protein
MEPPGAAGKADFPAFRIAYHFPLDATRDL